VLGNIAEDLSSRFKSGSGSGDYSLDFEDESDISNQNRLMGKGKGKERARDHDGYVRQADSSSTSHGQGAYPPLNEEEEQEKRVQTVRFSSIRGAAVGEIFVWPSLGAATASNLRSPTDTDDDHRILQSLRPERRRGERLHAHRV
jgi:hypothetical protein